MTSRSHFTLLINHWFLEGLFPGQQKYPTVRSLTQSCGRFFIIYCT